VVAVSLGVYSVLADYSRPWEGAPIQSWSVLIEVEK
jgi:hypothetical protein